MFIFKGSFNQHYVQHNTKYSMCTLKLVTKCTVPRSIPTISVAACVSYCVVH